VETKLLTGSDLNQISHLAAGDVMFDLDVTLTTGETMNLAQVLSQKKAVVLNFWFANCGYCTLEFPAIKQAYLQYADQLEVLALSPYDSTDAIKQYQGRHSLPFPMASCHASWPMAFGISGYPTTVIVDRYGVICAVHTGAVPDAATWEKMFAHFTAENYVQKLFDSLTDVG
jgi:peroxiredoxin